jgi:hypothetical protein
MMATVPQLVGEWQFWQKTRFSVEIDCFCVPAGSVSLEADRVNV